MFYLHHKLSECVCVIAYEFGHSSNVPMFWKVSNLGKIYTVAYRLLMFDDLLSTHFTRATNSRHSYFSMSYFSHLTNPFACLQTCFR